MNLLQDKYNQTIKAELIKELEIKNPMAVPKLVKIVINCSMGEALSDKKSLEKMAEQLSLITGQKAQITRAKKAISTFKLRIGDAIGLKTTLRGTRMYDFLLKLTTIALPRVRDFRGVQAKGFDGIGGYTLGISEQTIFPEIDYGVIDKVRGFECTFVTTAKNPKETKILLEKLGLPFVKEQHGKKV